MNCKSQISWTGYERSVFRNEEFVLSQCLHDSVSYRLVQRILQRQDDLLVNQGREFSLLQNAQTSSGVHTAYYAVHDGGSFPLE